MLHGILARESAMLDFAYELAEFALAGNDQASVNHIHDERPCRECSDEHHGLGALTDVDKAARAGEALPEARDIEVAASVDLGKAEEGTIEPAAVVEVELIGLVYDGLRIDRDAEIKPGGGHAADDAGLGG